MCNHIMVGSNDIERSAQLYGAVLGALGAGEPIRNGAPCGHVRLFYRPDGSTFCVSEPINGEPVTCANGVTVGFENGVRDRFSYRVVGLGRRAVRSGQRRFR